MRFIGFFLVLVTMFGLQEQVTFELLSWFAIGLSLMFFDVIIHLAKTEISARSYKRRC